MARGKYLSLEEARKQGKLDQFCREHEIEDSHPDGEARFWTLMDAMANGEPPESIKKARKRAGGDET